jgi:hypothetical protein
MPAEDNPSVGGRALEALRAVDLYPRGMRLSVHPKAMQTLAELGFVAERQAEWEGAKPGEMGWFITQAGRQFLYVLGSGDFG